MVTASEYGISYWGRENVLKLASGLVTQLCEKLKAAVRVNFMICESS